MSHLHPLDIIEAEINSFLDDRYPTFVPWKVSVLEAQRDILQEVSLLFKKHLPNEEHKPEVIIDENNVIHIYLQENNQ
jgi:hypothetical protein